LNQTTSSVWIASKLPRRSNRNLAAHAHLPRTAGLFFGVVFVFRAIINFQKASYTMPDQSEAGLKVRQSFPASASPLSMSRRAFPSTPFHFTWHSMRQKVTKSDLLASNTLSIIPSGAAILEWKGRDMLDKSWIR
jgi:hypothetical protein